MKKATLSEFVVTLDKFRLLIAEGEKAIVDFKLACNAFNKSAGDYIKARTELVKDICAMANNGPVASYLIIGVSDDAKRSQSVTDPNLTEQNIHTLIRDAIHPRPNIHVFKECWHRAPQPFNGISLLVIQIGPNAKHAFRFAQDRIDWTARIHFRKNEVWVRNGSTSDLATPEQIATLLATKTQRNGTLKLSDSSTSYSKLERSRQIAAMCEDTKRHFKEAGAKIVLVNDDKNTSCCDFRVSFLLRRQRFVFRCCFVADIPKNSLLTYAGRRWGLEHGLMFFSLGPIAAASNIYNLKVGVEEPWGSFAVAESKHFRGTPIPGDVWMGQMYDWPSRFQRVSIPIITIRNIQNTERLQTLASQCLDALQSDERLSKYVSEARRNMNEALLLSTRSGIDLKKDRTFNPDAVVRYKRSLRTVIRLAYPSRRRVR